MTARLTARQQPAVPVPRYPQRWRVAGTYDHHGRLVEHGDQVTIAGGKTWYTFIAHVVNPPEGRRRRTIEWLDLIGDDGFRSIRPDRLGGVRKPRPKNTKRKRS